MTGSDEDKQQRMLDNIRKDITEIREIIRDRSTESVVQRCLFEKGYPRPNLQSPAKQIAFLLGLMLATDEPKTGEEFTDSDWECVANALVRLFKVYLNRNLSSQEDLQDEMQLELQQREFATLAYINYFQTTTLAADEHIRDQITAYMIPFDDALSKDLGLSASDALTIVDSIIGIFKANLSTSSEGSAPLSTEAVLSNYRITRTDLIARHGPGADAFWKLFTVSRGDGPHLRYPTDQSIVELKPFVRLSNEVAFGCNMKEMLLPIFATCENSLLNGSLKQTYLKHRANTLEDQAAALLSQILGPSAKIYQNVFESADSQKEHDIIIVSDAICLFAEVKSSPPSEPFRDPEKAFVRLLRSFRSDTGIQKAYEQASNLLKAESINDVVILYDRHGNKVLKLPGSARDRAFCVCITRDAHGPMATYLSLMLEKKESDPFPWVVSVLDLKSIAEVWQFYRWDARQLRAFLSRREKLHKSILGDDELDYVGAYILHCGLQAFVSEAAMPVPINPTYSYIFDLVHDHLEGRGPPVRIAPVYPERDSVGRLLRTGESIYSMSRRQKPIKLMRNKLCPCGSGVKSKRCHGAL